MTFCACPQMAYAGGYDHNFVLRKGEAMGRAAKLYDPKSGRVMETLTDQPGVQFYTANWLPEGLPGKGGRPMFPRAGFCLETQHYPCSPNRPQFPSTILRPGEEYNETTLYRFRTR